MPELDISALADGVDLPPHLAEEVWANVYDESVVMRLAHETPLAGVGETIPVVGSLPEAEWLDTPNEPGDGHGVDVSMKTIKPRPAQVKMLVPKRIARNAKHLYRYITSEMPGALGRKLDRGALFDTAITGFDSLQTASTATLTDYAEAVGILGAIAGDGHVTNGFALNELGEIAVLGIEDDNKRPIFTRDAQTEGSIGHILARRVVKGETAGTSGTIGFAGDWRKMHYGIVRDSIEIKADDKAAVTVGLKEIEFSDGDSGTLTADIPHIVTPYDRDLVVLIARCEFGVAIEDVDAFRRITG